MSCHRSSVKTKLTPPTRFLHQRRKSEALARAREQMQRKEGTFRPKINGRSERIACRMGLEEIDVADRLTTLASTASLGRKLRCVVRM